MVQFGDFVPISHTGSTNSLRRMKMVEEDVFSSLVFSQVGRKNNSLVCARLLAHRNKISIPPTYLLLGKAESWMEVCPLSWIQLTNHQLIKAHSSCVDNVSTSALLRYKQLQTYMLAENMNLSSRFLLFPALMEK